MPKRVILSHRNITNNAIFSAQRLGIDSTDVLCLAIPLFHCFGLVSGLYFSLMTGCRLVILDSYNTEEILSAVQRYRCTTLHGVPTIFNRLIQHETLAQYAIDTGNDSNLLIVFYVQIMPDDLVMQLHRF